jgi:hypothetical protein
MNFRLYAAAHVWLVVPDCMRDSQAAVDKFGPLRFIGVFDEAALNEDQRACVMAGFDAVSFALVPESLVRRLAPGSDTSHD